MNMPAAPSPCLYSYFESKEELFFEVVIKATEAGVPGHARGARPGAGRHHSASAAAFGERLLALLYSPQVRSVRRLLMSKPVGRSWD